MKIDDVLTCHVDKEALLRPGGIPGEVNCDIVAERVPGSIPVCAVAARASTCAGQLTVRAEDVADVDVILAVLVRRETQRGSLHPHETVFVAVDLKYLPMLAVANLGVLKNCLL